MQDQSIQFSDGEKTVNRNFGNLPWRKNPPETGNSEITIPIEHFPADIFCWKHFLKTFPTEIIRRKVSTRYFQAEMFFFRRKFSLIQMQVGFYIWPEKKISFQSENINIVNEFQWLFELNMCYVTRYDSICRVNIIHKLFPPE